MQTHTPVCFATHVRLPTRASKDCNRAQRALYTHVTRQPRAAARNLHCTLGGQSCPAIESFEEILHGFNREYATEPPERRKAATLRAHLESTGFATLSWHGAFVHC
ncbi:protein of unknown function [Bradyrhizobium vignae]|uniref:Uncharacterized protein n=1 Tax=Bradyrhizobium vignae TaxID=1549949 RepID=A0A2U3QA52_9BRAD|nr:protein of unknown function [Bradyrhizobium vignae]